MKRTWMILAAVMILTAAGIASAARCSACKDTSLTRSTARCVRCKKLNVRRPQRLCAACGKGLAQCEICLKRLDGPKVTPVTPAVKLPAKLLQPMLWKVTGRGLAKPSYLLGTIHLGDKRIIGTAAARNLKTRPPTASPEINRAYDSADDIFTEIKLLDPKVLSEIMAKGMLPEGKTLGAVVSKKTFAAVQQALSAIAKDHPQLSKHPAGAKMLYMQIAQMKSWLAAVSLAMLEATLKYAGRPPLDQVLCETAVARGKPVYGLETAQEHVGALNALSAAEQEIFLRAACRGIFDAKAQKKDPIAELLGAYLRGDMKAIAASFARDREQSKKYMPTALYDKIMTGLLADRNVCMAKAIAARLVAAPQRSGFFAVGVGHMLGKTGLVEALRAAGYTVTRVKASVKSKSSVTQTQQNQPTTPAATKRAA